MTKKLSCLSMENKGEYVIYYSSLINYNKILFYDCNRITLTLCKLYLYLIYIFCYMMPNIKLNCLCPDEFPSTFYINYMSVNCNVILFKTWNSLKESIFCTSYFYYIIISSGCFQYCLLFKRLYNHLTYSLKIEIVNLFPSSKIFKIVGNLLN